MDLDIWSHIIELSNFKMKLKILKLSYSHYNYDFIIKEISINTTYLTDDILKQKKYHKLHTLNASNNSKITDEGIKHMQLHTLNANGNKKITDEGIKHMQLHTLYASYNSKITDEGIKHLTDCRITRLKH